jgi:hypothetical protein
MVDYSVLAMCVGGGIGYAAAQHKGYSPLAGAACGVLMGPIFSWLLFAIDGILRPSERLRCPHCLEWLNAGADVCHHCGRAAAAAVPPRPGAPRLVYSKRE